MTQDELMERIAKFRARYDMTKSAFGVMAVNAGNLISQVEDGRKLRAKTIEKIIARMDMYEAEQRVIEDAALRRVQAVGFVTVDKRGEPCLETNSQIATDLFQRLVRAGRLIPNNDAMFDCASQTYRVSEDAYA